MEETVYVAILVTSKNDDRKKHVAYQNNQWTTHENKEMEPFQLVQMNLYYGNPFVKDIG